METQEEKEEIQVENQPLFTMQKPFLTGEKRFIRINGMTVVQNPNLYKPVNFASPKPIQSGQ